MKYSLKKDNLKISDLSIERIDEVERKNLQLNLELFPNEINIYYEIRWLYEKLFNEVSDELVATAYLFKESGHCFMFGFQQILRLHLVEASSSLRKAIESTAYAVTISGSNDKIKLWIKRDDNTKEFNEKVDKIKWQDSRTKRLKPAFDFLSNYSGHANLFGQIQRYRLNKKEILFGYFDIMTSNPKISVMRQLNYCLHMHLVLLELYSNVFNEIKSDKIKWDDKLKNVINMHKNYKNSKREMLDPKHIQ